MRQPQLCPLGVPFVGGVGGGTDAETRKCSPVRLSGICSEDAQEGGVSWSQRFLVRAWSEGSEGVFWLSLERWAHLLGAQMQRGWESGHGQQDPQLGGGKQRQMFWHLLGFDAAGQKVEALVLVGRVASHGGAVCRVFLIAGSPGPCQPGPWCACSLQL